MTDETPTDPGWRQFHRWGPYALLGLGALVSITTAGVLMSPGQRDAAAALAAAALFWQLVWDRRLRELPERSPGRAVYFAVRTAVAFVLSWLNPYFSIFAVMGYFDAGRNLPAPLRRYGLLIVAATLATAQSAGPGVRPHSGVVQWAVFGALFAVHASLALVLDRLGDREAAKNREQQATIAALERVNARLAQALAENEALQAQLLLQAREAGVADERRRLAAEIHDTLAQGLTGIVTQLQAAVDSGGTDAARVHVERAAALARYSLGEARRSVHNLTPGPLVHQTLPEALKETIAHWSATSPARLELTVTGTVEPLHEEIEATLLRITEEALSNAAKHADASRVGVTLSYLDDEVTLDVRDDGRGFDIHRPPLRTARGGFGLDGMKVRAERVAGHAAIESERGDGTAVSVHVPLVRHGS